MSRLVRLASRPRPSCCQSYHPVGRTPMPGHARYSRNHHRECGLPRRGAPPMSGLLTVKAQVDDGAVVTVRGRDAWALLQLKASNQSGCTPIEHPGPRWSGYVHKLRKLGIVIETLREAHGGPFSGQHARYVLRSLITIVEKEGGKP